MAVGLDAPPHARQTLPVADVLVLLVVALALGAMSLSLPVRPGVRAADAATGGPGGCVEARAGLR